jgi:hypothetical protein
MSNMPFACIGVPSILNLGLAWVAAGPVLNISNNLLNADGRFGNCAPHPVQNRDRVLNCGALHLEQIIFGIAFILGLDNFGFLQS